MSQTRWRGVVCAARSGAVVVLLISSGLVVSSGPAAAADGSGGVVPEPGEPVPVSAAGNPDVDTPAPSHDRYVWPGPEEVRWPEPAAATVDVSAAGVRAGGTLVVVAAAAAGDRLAPGSARFVVPDGPDSVRVEVLDRSAAEAVGVDGVLLAVEAVAGSGQIELALDYSGFAGSYGGAWASRLRLVQLPACSLTAPRLPACRGATPVASENDSGARQVSARVPVGSGRSVFALTAGESSDSGDWTATDLEAAGTWTHGGGSGGFTYGYPLRLPPAVGPVPEVSLTYSSQSHDGRTSGSNNQASWIGDGWTYQAGFVERTYRSCAEDMDGGNNGEETGDLCWDGDSPAVTLALNGVSTSLVKDDDSGQWRAASDQGWRVEHVGSVATPSGATTERWVVTTTDGTRYFFAGEASTSQSRWTVPVFGNHSGEACHSSQFAGSACRQAYRWLLDKVVDTSGNLARYFYSPETGHYGAAGDPDDRRSYHRGGRLTRVDYGLRSGGSGPATGRVVFTAADRCLADCWSGGDPEPQNWPDTPWDRACQAAPCTEQRSPAFFSSKRLARITTQVRDGSGFADVDSWQLTHEFLDYGDESQVVMWLKSIQHTGHVGGSKTLPGMSFTGWALPNRVDHNGIPAIWRSRLSAVTTETGGVITVDYSDPDCGAGDLPAAPEDNARLCYPSWWLPELFSEPTMDWFHKYVVESVAEQETTAAGGMVWTSYDYSTAGGGTSVLWAWDDSEFTEEEHRTYSQWRGYPQVTTRVGDPADGARLTTRTRYYRGMDGQPLPGGGQRSVQLSDSEGNQVTDHRALSGTTWEAASYLDGSIDSATTYRYWTRRTATRGHDGGDLEAWLARVERQDTRKRLVGSTWQRTRVTTSYDNRGRPVDTDDRGDTSRSGDERCTRTEYADNTSAWILEAVSRSEAVAVSCGTAPQRPADVIADSRTFYDGTTTHGAAPSKGLPTRTEVLHGWDGGPVYATMTTVVYDSLGRPVATTDPLGNTSTAEFTPPGAGPVTRMVATNPLGHAVIMDYQPAWGRPTAIVDANGRRTQVAYDPVGRMTAVWLPGRNPATQSANVLFEYEINDDAPSVVTTKRINAKGGYVTSTALFDSLYRGIQTQAETPRGGRLVTETAYNTRGQIEYSSGPNWDETSGPDGTFVRVDQGADHARTWYTYDTLGRETRKELWSKNVKLWQTTTGYGGSTTGFLTRITPPDGAIPTGTVTNANGEAMEKRDYHGDAATGAFDATTYAYDPKGRLATVTDPAGNAWSFEYDLRGRKVASHDPDSGTITASYDVAGRVTSATDARGETLATVYDPLSRPVQRWEGQASTGELVAAWSYDTVAGGVGMPATASALVDGHEIVTRVGSYDTAGRPTRTTVTVPPIPGLEPLAGDYLSIQQFNIDGTVATLALPAVGGLPREGITFTYNDLGMPQRMVGSLITTGQTQVYVDSVTYTAWGELAQRTLGASHENQVYHSYSYADGTRRLQEFRLSRDAVGATNVAHLQYEYDDAGNVLSIADAVEDPPGEPERQCFVYDHLRRLTEAWSQAGVDPCAEQPSTQAMGGPAPYWSSYTFDVTGNRTSQTRHSTGGGSQASIYAYPGHGGPQPHALSTVTTGGQVDSYSYDAAGNLTSRTVDEATDTIEWNAHGKPEAINDESGATTELVYHSDGTRIARIDGNGDAHLFLAGHEISYTAATGIVTALRTYQHNGDVIATRSTIHGLQWLASDHHSTASWAIAATTLAVTYRRRDPYGNPRGPQQDWPAGQEGFVRGIDDPTGLVHIGARSYDPTTGRFISDDPITDFSDTQQTNGYTYANGNPVSFSDPTGQRLCADTACTETVSPRPRRPKDGPRRPRDETTPGKPFPVPGGYNALPPGLEPVYVGTVSFTIEVDSYSYLEVTATAYAWCNEDMTYCDRYRNQETGTNELYVELILQTVIEVAKPGVQAPGRYLESDGWVYSGEHTQRLLYVDSNIYGRVPPAPSSPLADFAAGSLAAAGLAKNVLEPANDAYGGAHKASPNRIPRGPTLKTAGRFVPWLGAGVDFAGNLADGESLAAAAAQSAAGAAGGWAGGQAGMLVGLKLSGLGAFCGPLFWLCGAAIVGGFTAGGALAGQWAAGELAEYGTERAGW